MSDHIAGEDLAAYVDGTLKGEAKAGVEAHLSRCPECLEALADIVGIRDSRVKIPDEFLRKALEVSGEGIRGEKEEPARLAFPMRLVLGAAAVLLVVVVLGHFFLARGRVAAPGSKRTELADSQPAAPAYSRHDDAGKEITSAEAGKAKPAAAVGSASAPQALKVPEEGIVQVPAEATRTAAPADLDTQKKVREDSFAAARLRGTAPAKEAAPAPAVMKEEVLADEAAAAPRQEQEAGVKEGGAQGVVGGVLGGVKTASEKDKANVLKLEEPRRKVQAPEEKLLARRAPSAQDAARNAFQIVLAVSGRAAAPLSLHMPDLSSGPRIRVAGDVSLADLRNPGLLDGWSWFPGGAAMELAVASDGSVSAVKLVGQWEQRAAATARTEAGRLLFSASSTRSRRAVLTVSEAPPN